MLTAPYPDCEGLAERIRTKTFFPILRHLGFHPVPPEEVRAEVEAGVDLARLSHTWSCASAPELA